MLASTWARMLKLLAKHYREEGMETLDIWSESKCSKSEQDGCKVNLIEFGTALVQESRFVFFLA